MMQHDEGQLASGLFWQAWMPDTPKAIVVLAHGLAEHSGRYSHVAEALADRQIATFAVDHLGHGKSPGQRCVIERFDQYQDGIDTLYALAVARFSDIPVFMLGHSMGGLIAGLSVLRHPDRYQGLIMTGPAVMPVDPPPAWQEWVVGLVSRWLPAAGVVALEAEAISRDPAVVDDYLNDPLVHNGKVTARLAVEIFGEMEYFRSHASEINIPLLVMHGASDRLTAPEGSRWVAEAASSADKTLVIADDAYHELFNEPDRQIYIDRLKDWVADRC
ncbi:MAG: lysophospholipase [Woeseiaceae bacterium]